MGPMHGHLQPLCATERVDHCIGKQLNSCMGHSSANVCGSITQALAGGLCAVLCAVHGLHQPPRQCRCWLWGCVKSTLVARKSCPSLLGFFLVAVWPGFLGIACHGLVELHRPGSFVAVQTSFTRLP